MTSRHLCFLHMRKKTHKRDLHKSNSKRDLHKTYHKRDLCTNGKKRHTWINVEKKPINEFAEVAVEAAARRCTHTHTHMHLHILAHTHTLKLSPIAEMAVDAAARRCKHTHTHAHTHTHTHTHAMWEERATCQVLCNILYISYLVRWLRFQCDISWLIVATPWLYLWTWKHLVRFHQIGLLCQPATLCLVFTSPSVSTVFLVMSQSWLRCRNYHQKMYSTEYAK